jgi:hypothetical protein
VRRLACLLNKPALNGIQKTLPRGFPQDCTKLNSAGFCTAVACARTAGKAVLSGSAGQTQRDRQNVFVKEHSNCAADLIANLLLLRICSWKLGTEVYGELFVKFGLICLLHLIKRTTDERTGRFKYPLTLRASEAQKILALNPHQLACHCRAPSPLRNGTSSYGTQNLTGKIGGSGGTRTR